MGIRNSVSKKLNSSSGASLLYAIMLFMAATLVAVLILSSSLTALKRSRAQVESRQASLMLDSTADMLLDYLDPSSGEGGMTYSITTTGVCVETEVSRGGRVEETTYTDPVYSYERSLEVSHRDQSYSSKVYDEAVSSCTEDSSGTVSAVTYSEPDDPDVFLPEMIQNGLLKGLTYIDTGAAKSISLSYKSEDHKTDDGVIYISLPEDPSAGRNTVMNQARAVKLTYEILPASKDSDYTDEDEKSTDHEIIFTLTLEKKGDTEGSYEDMDYKTYIVIPVGSINDTEVSSTSTWKSSHTDQRTHKTTTEYDVTKVSTRSISWAAGSVVDTDPLAEE